VSTGSHFWSCHPCGLVAGIHLNERQGWIPAFALARQSASARRRGNEEKMWGYEKTKNDGLDSRFTMPDDSGQRKSDFLNRRLK